MTDPEIKIHVHTMPMLDTGLGREAGFKDDAELIEHCRKEREAMDPWLRELLERFDAEVQRQMLFGDVDSESLSGAQQIAPPD